jgi:hypothetical protein
MREVAEPSDRLLASEFERDYDDLPEDVLSFLAADDVDLLDECRRYGYTPEFVCAGALYSLKSANFNVVLAAFRICAKLIKSEMIDDAILKCFADVLREKVQSAIEDHGRYPGATKSIVSILVAIAGMRSLSFDHVFYEGIRMFPLFALERRGDPDAFRVRIMALEFFIIYMRRYRRDAMLGLEIPADIWKIVNDNIRRGDIAGDEFAISCVFLGEWASIYHYIPTVEEGELIGILSEERLIDFISLYLMRAISYDSPNHSAARAIASWAVLRPLFNCEQELSYELRELIFDLFGYLGRVAGAELCASFVAIGTLDGLVSLVEEGDLEGIGEMAYVVLDWQWRVNLNDVLVASVEFNEMMLWASEFGESEGAQVRHEVREDVASMMTLLGEVGAWRRREENI